MIKKIFLTGNPNVGKSVVFSRLTGLNVIVSNYPGTTVELAKGYMGKTEQKVEVIDLPGIYSLEPTSRVEEVAASVLKQEEKSQAVLVNILDATNLERNLYLTLQLLEEGFAVVVCLNMCDETVHRGIAINVQKLQELLGVAVVPTCAVTGSGIKQLIEKIESARLAHRPKLSHQQRWQQIGTIIEECQVLSHRHHTLREALEDASLRPASGWLIAIAVLYLSFRGVRFAAEFIINRLMDPLFINAYQPFLDNLSLGLGKEGFLHHLLIGELINGKIDFKQSLGLLTTAPYIELAMVLPYILSFYFILGILEDTGFLPRLAMLLDSLLHKIGLHGYSIIPVLLGFGCNVPGILSTRILESRRERFITATLISIGVPCVALQAMVVALLAKHSGFYILGVYLVLFAVWLMLGLILNKSVKGYSPELLLEIPPYRFPPPNMLFKKLYLRIKGFIVEAIPIVLLGVALANLLLFFHLFDFFNAILAPLVSGLFGLPKEAAVSLLVGFLRKDIAVGMLMPLDLSLKQQFIAACVLSASFPCAATFVVLLKELGVRDFIKATAIMIVTGVLVGTLLNFTIR